MTSKSFSRCKNIRFKTKSFANNVKFIKRFRARLDRRKNKAILKYTNDDTKLINIIRCNNGNLEVA